MFDFRAPDGDLNLKLCASGEHWNLCAGGAPPFHHDNIGFCAPTCAPRANAVRRTCPAHAPFIPYWSIWNIDNATPPEFSYSNRLCKASLGTLWKKDPWVPYHYYFYVYCL